mmetsp:Transcript_16194/g.54618  ORF Transcript_16194/g.54618 Transcript_16194/m.54618 type:complete len:438 (-) Transcript_16194:43-1356(-)
MLRAVALRREAPRVRLLRTFSMRPPGKRLALCGSRTAARCGGRPLGHDALARCGSRAVARRPLFTEASRDALSQSPHRLVRIPARALASLGYWMSRWYVAYPLRAARIMFIGAGIFSAGVSAGVATYAADPAKKEAELLAAAAAGGGAATVHVFDARKPGHVLVHSKGACALEARATAPAATLQVERRVHVVLERVLAGARQLAADRLRQAEEALAQQNLGMEGAVLRHEVEDAKGALARVSGHWRLAVLDSPGAAPNAFVTALCPRTFFVNEGLVLALEPSDDELAWCLGHELAHLMHDHTQRQTAAAAMLYSAVIVVMSFIDPTYGFFTDGLVHFAASLLTLAFSRAHELEADSSGLEIAAAACFDTRAGITLLQKMGQNSTAGGWLSTHPASADRHDQLAGLAERIHKDAPSYGPHCQSVRRALATVFWNKPTF